MSTHPNGSISDAEIVARAQQAAEELALQVTMAVLRAVPKDMLPEIVDAGLAFAEAMPYVYQSAQEDAARLNIRPICQVPAHARNL